MSRQFKSESGRAIMGGESVVVNPMKSQSSIDNSLNRSGLILPSEEVQSGKPVVKKKKELLMSSHLMRKAWKRS